GTAVTSRTGDLGGESSGGDQREANKEGRALANAALEGQRATVLIDNHGTRDRKALSRAPPHALRRVEGVEDPTANLLRNPSACIGDAQLDPAVLLASADGDRATRVGVRADCVLDRVGGVDHDVQDGLVELTGEARDERERGV